MATRLTPPSPPKISTRISRPGSTSTSLRTVGTSAVTRNTTVLPVVSALPQTSLTQRSISGLRPTAAASSTMASSTGLRSSKRVPLDLRVVQEEEEEEEIEEEAVEEEAIEEEDSIRPATPLYSNTHPSTAGTTLQRSRATVRAPARSVSRSPSPTRSTSPLVASSSSAFTTDAASAASTTVTSRRSSTTAPLASSTRASLPRPSLTMEAEGKSVEEMLSEKGFFVVDKLFQDSQRGEYKADGSYDRRSSLRTGYVKVQTNWGQSALIDLDKPVGTIYYTDDNRIMVTENVATMVPASTLSASCDIATANGSCGVAWDCGKEGFCVVSRPSDSVDKPTTVVMKEISRTTVDGLPEAKVETISGVPTPYTLVRLSDALDFPDETKRVISRSNKALREAVFAESVKPWVDLDQAIQQLYLARDAYQSAVVGSFNNVNNDIAFFERKRDEYRAARPLSVEDTIKANNTIDNLIIRQELYTKLAAKSQKIPDTTTEILKLTAKMQKGAEKVRQEYGRLAEVEGADLTLAKKDGADSTLATRSAE